MINSIYLTINDFAKMHNVNKRTLHYYDSIGIFQPQKVGENGYRYYTYMQGAEFEIILALRELGMSIDEIREYQKKRTANELERLLLEKSEEIDCKISQLKELKKMLNTKRENLLKAQSSEINEIDVIYCKPEYLFVTDLNGLKSESDLSEKVYGNLAKYWKNGKSVRAFNSGYGSMISTKKIIDRQFERYQYLYVIIPKPKSKAGLFLKPAGNYIRAFCKGEWDRIPATYERILDYAEQNNLKLTGYSYEEGINELGIPSASAMSEYVTQILVQCEEKT